VGAILTKMIRADPFEIIPWVFGVLLVVTRLTIYRTLKRLLIPFSLAYIALRLTDENPSISILRYFVQILDTYVTQSVIRDVIEDVVGLLIIYRLVKYINNFTFDKKEIVSFLFKYVEMLPMVQQELDKEKRGIEVSLDKSLKEQCRQMGHSNNALPINGLDPVDVIRNMTRLARKDDLHWQNGKVSGAVYLGEKEHVDFLNKAFSLYSLSNPLHAELWPSIMKFESEVIAMTASMMNGGNSSVVGAVSSGGTESIVLAIKTHRDYFRDKYGITEPEMVACVTAHAAVNKGCDLLGVKLVQVPVNPETLEINMSALERAIGPNTIMMYGSAPNFPHGTIDPIGKMSDLAVKYGIGLHVDCCLGGFVLPFAKKLGYNIPGKDS
jgi:sphinganine-1-phosphate aldolase